MKGAGFEGSAPTDTVIGKLVPGAPSSAGTRTVIEAAEMDTTSPGTAPNLTCSVVPHPTPASTISSPGMPTSGETP